VAVLEAPGPQDLLARLGGQVDLGRSVETGQLELPAPADAYLHSGFGAEVLMDTLRTHPRVIVDGMMYDNPYYIEPGKFLATRG
jgi:hypothetical protein